MEIIRRNTDYGLRMMVALANSYGSGELISATQLVQKGNIAYEVGRKMLQRLREAELVKTVMGPKGGFALNKSPSDISLMEIIAVLQGKLCLNACLADDKGCEFESGCKINTKLSFLQQHLDDYLENITLEEISDNRNEKKTNLVIANSYVKTD